MSVTPPLPAHCQHCEWTCNNICRHPIILTDRKWQINHINAAAGPCIFYRPHEFGRTVL